MVEAHRNKTALFENQRTRKVMVSLRNDESYLRARVFNDHNNNIKILSISKSIYDNHTHMRTRGSTVTVMENGHSELSSNPERGCLRFSSRWVFPWGRGWVNAYRI